MPRFPKSVKFEHLKGAVTLESSTRTTGMCFHRAAGMVLDLPGAEMVFGTFRPASDEERAVDPRLSAVPFIHAWVEWRGQVFAPSALERTRGLVAMPPEGYYAINQARNIKRLPRPELLRIARETGLSAHLRKHRPLKASFVDAILKEAGIEFTIHDDGGVLPAEEDK